MVSPLRLKREVVGKVPIASNRPFLSILVDTGVFHLDQAFEYLLPEKIEVEIGDWVSVPFNGRNCLGLIVDRYSKGRNNSASSRSLPINKKVRGPQVSPKHLALYQAIAARWAVPIFDVLRFVSKGSGAENFNQITSIKSPHGATRTYLQLRPDESEITQLVSKLHEIAKTGTTLVIVPEAKLVGQIASKEYEVGARGSVLSSRSYKNLVVVREESGHHFELKSPGFNSRDVALLRSEYLNENLYFVGFAPSLEMMRLIDIGFVKYKGQNVDSGSIKVLAQSSVNGELIPSSLIKNVKQYLNQNPLLVVAPAKGYGLAISCANCRNIAKCNCGGKLTKRSRSEDPVCTICHTSYQDWKCAFCKREKIYLLGRGIERIAEEFGRSFPNTEIHISTKDKEIEGQIGRRSIVLSTVGSVPNIQYSAALFLDGLSLGADLRSEERYLALLMRYTASANGHAMLVERSDHPVVPALIRWKPLPYLERILKELQEAELPPYTRHATFSDCEDESDRIYAGLKNAIREGRLSNRSQIYQLDDGRISLFFPMKEGAKCAKFLNEFQKRRSISGKRVLSLRIDSYDLS